MGRVIWSRLGVALIAALVSGGAVALAWVISSSGSSDLSGRVRLSFEPGPPQDAALLEHSGLFASAIATVNYELHLPQDLMVRVIGDQTARQVGASDPFYEPSKHTVYFPWSFVTRSHADLERLPKASHASTDRTLSDAMVFALYHELAHGIFDVLDVPVVGSQEDDADNLATILAIVSRDGGEGVPLAFATLEEASARQSGAPGLISYADEHSFSLQRADDAICLVYGSDPNRYGDLVTSGQLPVQRAQTCPADYSENVRSWRRLLAPGLTHQGKFLPLN